MIKPRTVLYVGDVGKGAVKVFAADTLKTIGDIKLPGLGLPQALTLTPSGDQLLIALDWTPKYGAVVAIDTASLQIVATTTGNHQQPLFCTTGPVAIASHRHGVAGKHRLGSSSWTLIHWPCAG